MAINQLLLLNSVHSHSIIHRLDPRVKLVSAIFFSGWLILHPHWQALTSGLAITILLVLLAKLPPRLLYSRLLAVNSFLALIWALLPVTGWNPASLYWALNVTITANALVLTVTAFLTTTDLITLGYALHWLRVPDKLTHLLLFTVRYLDILHDTYQQLRRAMRVRGFRPGTNSHTYRSMAYLLGMLLVRSFARAQRIEAAMKCRGYRGQFYLNDHLTLTVVDGGFIGLFYGGLLWLTVLLA